MADIKYKSLTDHRLPEDDIYQLLAYCTALRLAEGHLIYARGDTQPATYVIGEAATRIVVSTVDLYQPPGQLLADLGRLAARIASGTPQPATAEAPSA